MSGGAEAPYTSSTVSGSVSTEGMGASLVVRRDEPFGHQDPYSKIERAWRESPDGFGITRRRVDRYDAASSLIYSPVEYEFFDVRPSLSQEPPADDWVRDALREFVRGEFGEGRPHPMPESFRPVINERSVVGLDLFEKLLENAEEELVYSSVIDSLREKNPEMEDAVMAVLCHPLLGHRKNTSSLPAASLRDTIVGQTRARDRLMLIVPAFPFKDQNRFRTLSGAAALDLGEISLLVRLHILSLALYQVHPFGADMVILSDGLVYSDVFGVDRGQALRYREQLRGFRNLLNLQGTVSILDLSEIVGHFRESSGGPSVLDETIESISESIRRLVRSDEGTKQVTQVLKRGMKWNLNTRDNLGHLDDRDAWLVLTEPHRNKLPKGVSSDWDFIEARAHESAIRYASLNLALRYQKVTSLLFPGSLRGTVHPKPGQIAVPCNGSVYPWNGVAHVSGKPWRIQDVESVPLHSLGTSGPMDLVRFDLTGEPLYLAAGTT